jgi:hypothetical protein
MQRKPMSHFTKHASSYAPAAAPFFIVCIAIILFVVAPLFENQVGVNGFITIALFGFSPLLLLSYILFYLIARPLGTLINRKLFSFSKIVLNLLTGTIYGAAIGAIIVICFNPKLLDAVMIFSFGIVVGIINWFSYCKLIELKA